MVSLPQLVPDSILDNMNLVRRDPKLQKQLQVAKNYGDTFFKMANYTSLLALEYKNNIAMHARIISPKHYNTNYVDTPSHDEK